ncbi:MAG: hypothetical protein ACJA0Z_003796 [Halioglobus sp.]
MIVDPITAESYRLSRGNGKKKIVFKPLAFPIMFELAIIRPAHRPISLLSSDFYTTIVSHLKQLKSIS